MIVGGGYPASYFLEYAGVPAGPEIGRPPYGVIVANAIGAGVPGTLSASTPNEIGVGVAGAHGVTLGGNLKVELT